MSVNNFKEKNKLFTVQNRSCFSGITFADTIESYKGTNTYESKNIYINSIVKYSNIFLN